MKFVSFLIATLLTFVLVAGETVFEKAFDSLHREPPLSGIRNRANVRTEWIEQKVDNFNESDSRTWKMRFMANEEYFKDGGPIFIFVGGEWEISDGSLKTGLMHDMAKELNGYLFYTEHRYYGRSYPTEDISNENLQYLNVDQALADLAHFIRTIKATIPGLKQSGVILVGGSYSATMVAWFKKIYPELATGSWGSSAPLLAKVDFTEYKEIVGESIKIVGGEKCLNRVQKGFEELEVLLAANKGEELKKLFKMCDNFDFTNKVDVWSFFGSLSDLFAGLVQTHNAGSIEKACEKILAAEDDFSGVLNWILSRLGSEDCNDFSYKEFIKSISYTTTYGGIMRQWYYQTCSEFGWYQTSGSKDQPFGSKFPVELYVKACEDAYGERFSNATIYGNIIATNSKYGGMNPEVSNVVLTHGQLDPWRAMGVQENEEGESNVIPLHAHCKDLSSLAKSDTEAMKKSKAKVKSLVYSWLGVNKY